MKKQSFWMKKITIVIPKLQNRRDRQSLQHLQDRRKQKMYGDVVLPHRIGAQNATKRFLRE